MANGHGGQTGQIARGAKGAKNCYYMYCMYSYLVTQTKPRERGMSAQIGLRDSAVGGVKGAAAMVLVPDWKKIKKKGSTSTAGKPFNDLMNALVVFYLKRHET